MTQQGNDFYIYIYRSHADKSARPPRCTRFRMRVYIIRARRMVRGTEKLPRCRRKKSRAYTHKVYLHRERLDRSRPLSFFPELFVAVYYRAGPTSRGKQSRWLGCVFTPAISLLYMSEKCSERSVWFRFYELPLSREK